MCPPLIAAIPGIATAIGGFVTSAGGAAAISAGTTAVSLYAQGQTAKATAAATGRQADNEAQEALERGEEELGQRVKLAREQRSRALVAGGESGAQGASFAASLNQSIQDQDETAALVQKNVTFSQRATEDRRNTALSSIRGTSILEAGLQIGAAGVSGFNSGLSLEAER